MYTGQSRYFHSIAQSKQYDSSTTRHGGSGRCTSVNSLPPALRSTSTSFTTFKKELKSFLFGLSFCLWQYILFIDYVQRSSSSLYRRLRYRNCLNYNYNYNSNCYSAIYQDNQHESVPEPNKHLNHTIGTVLCAGHPGWAGTRNDQTLSSLSSQYPRSVFSIYCKPKHLTFYHRIIHIILIYILSRCFKSILTHSLASGLWKSTGINGEGRSQGQPADPGSPGKMVSKTDVCVLHTPCACGCNFM